MIGLPSGLYEVALPRLFPRPDSLTAVAIALSILRHPDLSQPLLIFTVHRALGEHGEPVLQLVDLGVPGAALGWRSHVFVDGARGVFTGVLQMSTLYTGAPGVLSDVLGSFEKLQLETIPLTNNQVDVGSTHVTPPSLVICFRNILCACLRHRSGRKLSSLGPVAEVKGWGGSKRGKRRSMAEVGNKRTEGKRWGRWKFRWGN